MQLGMKVVAHLSPGAAVLEAPRITPHVRRDIMQRTLDLGSGLGPYIASVAVNLDGMVVVNLRVTMPDRQVYRSNGVIVPFAVEGADGQADWQDFAALYHLRVSAGEYWHGLFGPADQQDGSVTLLACERVSYRH